MMILTGLIVCLDVGVLLMGGFLIGINIVTGNILLGLFFSVLLYGYVCLAKPFYENIKEKGGDKNEIIIYTYKE